MKKIILFLALLCLPIMAEEWEYKIVEEVTDLTTWTNESVVYHNLKGNTIANLPDEIVLKEICKIYAKNKGFKGWKVIKTDIYYTKTTSKNKEGLAGKFWLAINLWMVREKIKPKPKLKPKKFYFSLEDKNGHCPSGCKPFDDDTFILPGVSVPIGCICEEK